MKITVSKKQRIRRTYSLCPVCLARIPADVVALAENGGETIRLEKRCGAHGFFSTVVWRGKTDYREWIKDAPKLLTEPMHCPENCGICGKHQKETCCTLLEVTGRCDLGCRFCFADGRGEEPTLLELKTAIDRLVKPGETFLQLSGGEPTLREDLPEIVAYARAAGCRYIQLNTNGLRLAKDKEFLRRLTEAGLSFVFLQFDGTNDEIYKKLRGQALFEPKIAAIENCGECGIGVTLVPTVVPGVNDDDLGNIIRFGVARSPAVRGVHFQPVSYFGRFPAAAEDEERVTLGELIDALDRETDGAVSIRSLRPSRCDHPLCGFHGSFIAAEGGLISLTKRSGREESCCSTTAEQNREYVGSRWTRDRAAESCCDDIGTLDGFYNLSRARSFTVSGMAFQDCYTVDLERIAECSLHVWDDGRMMPFCIKYITNTQGYRVYK